ncbi:OmpA/MotB family protein [Desulfotalea psychrophila]|uniref:Related to flagellar motor protein (MotB) n=1 Tax=Desulfotalea psychrophila (strain LSv54 / DSM 12343) TaxID=177439 RepID=Q6AJT1_DESPS|nr:flagellar motor protein MotB [Desulfotalea psychrophila]CAG37395.1 related to flagellar motor protein (MotB) [Desulfotalea psychrophila LSv54]
MSAEELPQKKEKKCAAGAPAWMVTYSDLVTLLLTFFVLLLSMSNVDPVRMSQASSSIKDAFGIPIKSVPTEYRVPIFPAMLIAKFSPVSIDNTKKIHEKIKNKLKALRINSEVELINKDKDIIILRMDDKVLFARGQSEISPRSYMLLRNIADIIRPLPVNVRIEGHSDDIPLGINNIANWNLSTSRAVSALRFFYRGNLISLDRLSAIGYGDMHPIAPNTTEENRAKNRRVDFVLRLKPPKKKPEIFK